MSLFEERLLAGGGIMPLFKKYGNKVCIYRGRNDVWLAKGVICVRLSLINNPFSFSLALQMFRVAVAESDASEEGTEGGQCGTGGGGCNTKEDLTW